MRRIISDAQLIDVRQIEENPWNPNAIEERLFKTLKTYMRRIGFVGAIVVRPISENRYQIIDGAHRYKAAIENGYTEIPCIVLSMDDAEAKLATLNFNRLKGEMESLKLADLIKDLDQSFDDLSKLTGFMESEIQYLIKSLDSGYDQFASDKKQQNDQEDGGLEWVRIEFVVPKQAVRVIEDEIQRLIKISEFETKNEEVRRGLALERMAVLSSQTPDESLA